MSGNFKKGMVYFSELHVILRKRFTTFMTKIFHSLMNKYLSKVISDISFKKMK